MISLQRDICENCDDVMDDDDCYYLDRQCITICEHCYNYHTRYIEDLEERVTDGYAERHYIQAPNGTWYSGIVAIIDAGDFVWSDYHEGLLDYDDATFTEVTGMEFVTGIYGANISVKGSLPLTILNNGVSQMTNVSTVGFSFFRPIYISQIYASNLSAKNITCNTLFQYTSGYGDYHNTVQSYAFYSSAQCAGIS